MKGEKWISAGWAFGFSFLLSAATTMCIVTAFQMQVETSLLLRVCAIAAAICSLCYSLPLRLVPIAGGAAILGYLWRLGALESSLEAFLNRLSRQYDRAYGWGIIRWGYRVAEEMEPDMVLTLCIIGSVIAMATAWAICRRRTLVPALALSLLSFATCFVVIDTVPGTFWLYLLFLCFVTLMMTGAARRQEEKQGNRLLLWLTPTVALALLLLFAVIPKNTYHRQEDAKRLIDSVIQSDSMQLLLGQLDQDNAISTDTNGVDLTSVGYRTQTHAQVLQVTAPYTGTLYLRGRAMDTYDGVSWRDSGKDYSNLSWPSHQLDAIGVVQISTRFSHRMLYLPYYTHPDKMRGLTLGLENTEELTQYDFPYYALSDPAYLRNLYPDPNRNTLYSGITIPLDQSMLDWAQPVVNSITTGVQSPYHKAQLIASFVRNSATYHTRTPRMPAKNANFVQWFLEESDTGYCIHFASAATVLLQAAGIPARYVTGYMAEVVSGETVTVYSDQAHAWTEYWLPGFGWTVLDATPADLTAETTQNTDQTVAPTTDETAHNTTPESTLPQGAQPPVTVKKEMDLRFLWILVCPAILFLIAAGAIFQRKLRLQLRQNRLALATPNEKALLYWQQGVVCGELLKESPPAALYRLAEKAKFSHYTLTDGELSQFSAYLSAAEEKLRTHNLFLRLYYRYILALY